MPNNLRCTVRAVLRTDPVHRSGNLDGGGSWSFWEIEVLDSDMNKANLRVQEGMGAALTVGQTYDFELDCATTGRPKFSVVRFQPVSAKAQAA